jgi:hypothetical protein
MIFFSYIKTHSENNYRCDTLNGHLYMPRPALLTGIPYSKPNDHAGQMSAPGPVPCMRTPCLQYQESPPGQLHAPGGSSVYGNHLFPAISDPWSRIRWPIVATSNPKSVLRWIMAAISDSKPGICWTLPTISDSEPGICGAWQPSAFLYPNYGGPLRPLVIGRSAFSEHRMWTALTIHEKGGYGTHCALVVQSNGEGGGNDTEISRS